MSAAHGRADASLTFLVDDAYGGGGIARTVANVANHLARDRRVRVISFHRGRDRPRYRLDPSIELSVVRDVRAPEGPLRRALAARPSRLRPTPSVRHMSLLTDLLLRRALRDVTTGVLVSTRPSLHLAASAFARPGVTTIGWDHLNFPRRFEDLRQFEVLSAAVPRLTAFAVLTDEDADDYRRLLPGTTEVRVIHNSVSWPVSEHCAPLDSKVIVSAGRLTASKGFPRLIRAFAPLARAHPDWQLHIYGKGPQRRALRQLIDALGVARQVRLKGYNADFAGVLAGASCYAMASRSEGFPMALIEALTAGLPLVAFDCPRGPAEIITHGGNGLLVPDGDVRALRAALRTVMADGQLRRKMGAQALRDAEQYTIDAIGADWARLFEDLAARG